MILSSQGRQLLWRDEAQDRVFQYSKDLAYETHFEQDVQCFSKIVLTKEALYKVNGRLLTVCNVGAYEGMHERTHEGVYVDKSARNWSYEEGLYTR